MRCERIKTDRAKDFILKKHYAHRMPSISFCFGLFTDDGLIGICTFGSPASPSLTIGVCGEKHRDKVIELNRLVINSNAPTNSASFLVGYALRHIGNKIVVSYADRGQNHNGYIYQATNFLYTGASKERTDMASTNGGHSRHSDGDRSKRVKRSSKHRYIYFAGHKRFRKIASSDLKYKVLLYPKEESKKYECQDIEPKSSLLEFI